MREPPAPGANPLAGGRIGCCCGCCGGGHCALLPPGAALPRANGSNTCCCACWAAGDGHVVLPLPPPSCRPANGSAGLTCAGRMGAAALALAPPNAQFGCAGAALAAGAVPPMGLPLPTCRPASPKAPPLLLGEGAAGGRAAAVLDCRVSPASRSLPFAAAAAAAAVGAAGTAMPPMPPLAPPLAGPIAVAAIQSLSVAAATAGLGLPLAMALPPAPLPAGTAPPARGLPSMPPAPRLRSMCATTSRTVLMAVANCWELSAGVTSRGASAGSTRSAARRGPHCAASELPSARTHIAVGADLSTAVTCGSDREERPRGPAVRDGFKLMSLCNPSSRSNRTNLQHSLGGSRHRAVLSPGAGGAGAEPRGKQAAPSQRLPAWPLLRLGRAEPPGGSWRQTSPPAPPLQGHREQAKSAALPQAHGSGQVGWQYGRAAAKQPR